MKLEQLYEEQIQLINYEMSTSSEATRKNYNSIITKFLEWCNNNQVDEITEATYNRTLDKYKTYLITRPQTYTTRDGKTVTKNKQLSQMRNVS